VDTHTFGFSLENLMYFVAGAGSTAVRAWQSEKQHTISMKSLIDVVYGGLSSLVFPAFFPAALVALNMIGKTAAVAVLAFTTNWALSAAAWRIGILTPVETTPTPPTPAAP